MLSFQNALMSAISPSTSIPTLTREIPVSARAEPLPALALWRFLAVAGVIWTHSLNRVQWDGSGFAFADAGRFGSAFFTQCSCFLVLLKSFGRRDLSWGDYAAGRFWRIYVPFLLWSLIYIVHIQVRHHKFNADEPYQFEWAVFWNGSEYHLWFLPFIFVAGMILFAFGRWLISVPRLALPIAAALVFVGAAAGLVHATIQPHHFGWDYMLRLGWNRVPSICWGASLAIAWHFAGRGTLRTVPVALLGIAAFVGSILTLGFAPHLYMFENLAGAGGMLMGVSILNRWAIPGSVQLARLTFGIYLSHIIFISAFRLFWHQTVGESNTLAFGLSATPAVLLGSALFSAFLTRTRGLKILVPV